MAINPDIITLVDIQRTKFHMCTIDDFVESNLLTTTTYDSKVIQTLAGITAGINQSQVAQNTAAIALKENKLNNPPVSGYILSSTSGGTRSWIAPPTAGAGVPSVVSHRTSTGTYTTPGGSLKGIKVTAIGPGGGGAGSIGSTQGGAGGGEGATVIKYLLPPFAASYALTIPAGGAGGAINNNGANGSGNTSFGSVCIAGPGGGGVATFTVPGLGGSTGTGDIIIPGMNGQGPYFQSAGGNIIGGAGGGKGGAVFLTRTTPLANWGGGGHGASIVSGSPAAGGAGAAGRIIIEEFY